MNIFLKIMLEIINFFIVASGVSMMVLIPYFIGAYIGKLIVDEFHKEKEDK